MRGIASYCWQIASYFLSKALYRTLDKSVQCFVATSDIVGNNFIQHLEEKLTNIYSFKLSSAIILVDSFCSLIDSSNKYWLLMFKKFCYVMFTYTWHLNGHSFFAIDVMTGWVMSLTDITIIVMVRLWMWEKWNPNVKFTPSISRSHATVVTGIICGWFRF